MIPRHSEQQQPKAEDVLKLADEMDAFVPMHIAPTASVRSDVQPICGVAATYLRAYAASLTVEPPDQWKALETLCEKWQNVKDVVADPDLKVVAAYLKASTAEECANALPELLRALKGITEENKELRQRDRVLSRQIERRACGRDEGSYALLRENAELAAHRDSLTAEVERLKGDLQATQDALRLAGNAGIDAQAELAALKGKWARLKQIAVVGIVRFR